VRAYESLAAVPGKSRNESRQGLLRCLMMTGQYEKVGAHRPAMLYEFTSREPMVL